MRGHTPVAFPLVIHGHLPMGGWTSGWHVVLLVQLGHMACSTVSPCPGAHGPLEILALTRIPLPWVLALTLACMQNGALLPSLYAASFDLVEL